MIMEKLTIRSYINNKSFDDKKKKEYIDRYRAISPKIHLKWFRMTDTQHLVMHFKIPSEKSKTLMYDTLIEFCTTSTTPYTLKNSDIKVFSNCPSYVFMNARFASMNGLSIKWAEPLFSKETLQPPTEDSGKELPKDIRIERGLFFAIYHISQLTDIELMAYSQKAYKIPNGDAITAFIRNQDWVMEKRGKVGAEFKFDSLYKKFGIEKKKDSTTYVKKANKIPSTKKVAFAGKTVGKISKIKKI